MKKVRTKEFNYNLNQSSANVFDYYEPNSQTLTEEELKHSTPETKVLRLGRDSDDASAYPVLFKRDSLTQGHAMVDFWASGFEYNNPTLVDPSLFHTWFKIYKNPQDPSMLVYNEGVLVPAGKEFLYNNVSDVDPKYLVFDISTDASFFDASVEYLSDNETGYWIGPAQINIFDNNSDIWRPKDGSVPAPVTGTEMSWLNTKDYEENYIIKDENGNEASTFTILYKNPGKVHVMVYPRDFTGTKMRRARVNFEAYSLYVDNFAAYDSSVPVEQRIKKNSSKSFFTITQAGKPIIINITADGAFNRNEMSYFQDGNGELIQMIGNTININSIYPAFMEGDIPYQYIGLDCVTNSAIKSVKILDEGKNPVPTNVANVYGYDDKPFEGFRPTESDIECNFYLKIKKYQIDNTESGDETLNQPLVYKVVITLDDGNNTSYEFKINQYGYIANDDVRCYHIYTEDNGQVLTDEEKMHSTPENKLKTSGTFLNDSYIFPIYFTNKIDNGDT